MSRWLIAGVVGGLLLFTWGFVSHAATELGETGLQSMPPDAEKAVGAALKANLPTAGAFIAGLAIAAIAKPKA